MGPGSRGQRACLDHLQAGILPIGKAGFGPSFADPGIVAGGALLAGLHTRLVVGVDVGPVRHKRANGPLNRQQRAPSVPGIGKQQRKVRLIDWRPPSLSAARVSLQESHRGSRQANHHHSAYIFGGIVQYLDEVTKKIVDSITQLLELACGRRSLLADTARALVHHLASTIEAFAQLGTHHQVACR